MAGIGPSPSQTFMDFKVYNALFPAEGAKAVPVPLNFASQQSYTVDLTLLQQRKFMSTFQSVFVDNSLSDAPCTINIQGSNQNIVCPGSSQGVFPIFVPGNAVFQVSSTGGQIVSLFFSNVPMPCSVWPATQSPLFNGNGAMEVTDASLDGAISGGLVNVLEQRQANNNFVKPVFSADELFTGSTTSTAAVTLITGNPSFFITEIEVCVTADAALAAAGELTVTVKDGATAILTGIVELPNATAAGELVNRIIEMRNLQYNSKTAANVLTLTLGTNMTAGKVYWNIAGGLCSNVGP